MCIVGNIFGEMINSFDGSFWNNFILWIIFFRIFRTLWTAIFAYRFHFSFFQVKTSYLCMLLIVTSGCVVKCPVATKLLQRNCIGNLYMLILRKLLCLTWTTRFDYNYLGEIPWTYRSTFCWKPFGFSFTRESFIFGSYLTI